MLQTRAYSRAFGPAHNHALQVWHLLTRAFYASRSRSLLATTKQLEGQLSTLRSAEQAQAERLAMELETHFHTKQGHGIQRMQWCMERVVLPWDRAAITDWYRNMRLGDLGLARRRLAEVQHTAVRLQAELDAMAQRRREAVQGLVRVVRVWPGPALEVGAALRGTVKAVLGCGAQPEAWRREVVQASRRAALRRSNGTLVAAQRAAMRGRVQAWRLGS